MNIMKQKGLTAFTTAVASGLLLLLAMIVSNGLQSANQQSAMFNPPVAQAQSDEVPLPAGVSIINVEDTDGALPEGSSVSIGDRITATIQISVDITAGDNTPVTWPVRPGDVIQVWSGSPEAPMSVMETFTLSETATTPGATNVSESGNAEITWTNYVSASDEWLFWFEASFGYSMAGDALYASWDSPVYGPPLSVSPPYLLDSRTGATITAPEDFWLNCEALPIPADTLDPDAPTITPTVQVQVPDNIAQDALTGTVTMSIIDHNEEAVDPDMVSLDSPGLPLDEIEETYVLSDFDPNVTYTVRAEVFILEDPIYGGGEPVDVVTDTFTVGEIPAELCEPVGPPAPGEVTQVVVIPEATQMISNSTQTITGEVTLQDVDNAGLEVGQTVPITFEVLDNLSTIGGGNMMMMNAVVISVDAGGATAVATATVGLQAGNQLGVTQVQATAGSVTSDPVSISIVNEIVDADGTDLTEEQLEDLLAGRPVTITVDGFEIVLPADLVNFLPDGVVGLRVEVINLIDNFNLSLASSTGISADRIVLNYVFRIQLTILNDPNDPNSGTRIEFWAGTYPNGDPSQPLGSLLSPGIKIKTTYTINVAIEFRTFFRYYVFLSNLPASIGVAQDVAEQWRTGTDTNTILDLNTAEPDPGGTIQSGDRVFRQENLSGTEFALVTQDEANLYLPTIGNFLTPTTTTLTLK